MRKISEEKAAILGYLHSDGCLSSRKKVTGNMRYEISFANKNKEIIKDFIRLTKTVYPFARPHINNVKDCTKVVLYSKQIFLDLSSFGKSSTKDWSPPINLFTKDEAKAYIQTLFYGDGGVSRDGSRIFIECQSLDGLRAVKNMLHQFFGIKSLIRKRRRRDIYILAIDDATSKWLFYKKIGLPLCAKKHDRIKSGLQRISRTANWFVPKSLDNKLILEWINFFFGKNGVFDCRKGRVYLKNISKGELKNLQKLLIKYNIRSAKIVGPTKHGKQYILMINNLHDLENLNRILTRLPKSRKRRLKNVIVKRGDMSA